MKKSLFTILALLLTVVMLGTFAACNTNDDPTEATTTEAIEPLTEEALPEETSAIEDTSDADITSEEPGLSEDAAAAAAATASTSVVTSKSGDTTAATTTTAATGKTPDKMNKEELVKYYNDAVNNVRDKKPQISRTEVLKIKSVKLSLGGGMADGIASRLVNDKMPGNPESSTIAKGKDNTGDFMTVTSRSVAKASDVTSASATKSGENYVITLTLGNETNPAKDGSSKYSRFFSIATRQDVLDDIKDVVTADVNKCTLTYNGGKVVITVNPEGQIIKAHGEFKVDADAKEVKVGPLKSDLIAYQISTNDYTNFKY